MTHRDPRIRLPSGTGLGVSPRNNGNIAMKSELLHDVRLVDRNLSRGRLSQDDLAQYLNALPDAGTNAANLEASLPEQFQAEDPLKGGKGSTVRKSDK